MEENNYEIEPQPTEKTVNKKTEYIVMAVLGLLLLASLGYNIYQYQHQKKETDKLQLVVNNTKADREKLQIELDSITQEFEKSRIEITEKDSLLTQRDSKIFEKQKEIQTILSKSDISESELKQAKRMIAALNGDIARFKEEIAVLKQQNDSLLVQNDTLRFRQFQMSDKLQQEKSKSLATETKMKSTFSISNYEIHGLRVKKSGKEIETDKAKRIDKLRVSFDLDPNEAAKSGEKEIYIAIYKPDGQLGKFKGAEPGQLESWSLGKVDYSDKVKFDYTQGTKQNISFDWEEYEFPKGNYKIDLYQNGLKIGSKNLALR